MPNNNRQANATPLAAAHGLPGRLGKARVELVGAVVEMVSVAVPAVAPLMFTGLVEPKLKVGGYSAPVGLEVTAAVSATLPVKPPDGVTEIVEVFPEVAPGDTETAVPVTVKLGIGTAVPVPVRVAVCGEPVALSATDNVAEKLVAEAGVKVM
jgi:hypothetical protein